MNNLATRSLSQNQIVPLEAFTENTLRINDFMANFQFFQKNNQNFATVHKQKI